MNVLKVENLHVSYQTNMQLHEVVHGVDFAVEEMKTLALVGESGCGKTTIARCIMNVLANNATITKGRIFWKDKDVLQMSEHETHSIRSTQIAMLFQDPRAMLNPVLTIEKQLRECICVHHAYTKDEIKKKIIALLRSVQISDTQQVLRAYPFQLSLGMCQRIMIAMAIASEATLWIVDEPTSALDMLVQADILDLLKQLQTQRKLSMLCITHELRILPSISDVVAILYDGEIVEWIQSTRLFEEGIEHHPYTQSLLDALNFKHIVHFEEQQVDKEEDGCRYAPKCSQAKQICHMKQAPMKQQSKGHKVRCHLL